MGFSFLSHPRPDIFSCTKQLVLLLDIGNWCVLSYYFNVGYELMNTLVCSANSFHIVILLVIYL